MKELEVSVLFSFYGAECNRDTITLCVLDGVPCPAWFTVINCDDSVAMVHHPLVSYLEAISRIALTDVSDKV